MMLQSEGDSGSFVGNEWGRGDSTDNFILYQQKIKKKKPYKCFNKIFIWIYFYFFKDGNNLMMLADNLSLTLLSSSIL